MFYRVDFTTATSKTELEQFEQGYRGLRELLQWSIDKLQQPAQQQVVTLRVKATQGALVEQDLEVAKQVLREMVSKTAYENSDAESYIQDLVLLVEREYARLKYGETSGEFAKYAQPLREMETLQLQAQVVMRQQMETMKEQQIKLGGANA